MQCVVARQDSEGTINKMMNGSVFLSIHSVKNASKLDSELKGVENTSSSSSSTTDLTWP